MVGDIRGGVLIAASTSIRGRRAVWQVERATADLLESDAERMASVLAAVAHPVRMQVVLLLLRGSRTAAELAELASTASPGKLYHHLEKLLAAGVIHQPERSRYAILPAHEVPLLALLSAATDIGGQPDG